MNLRLLGRSHRLIIVTHASPRVNQGNRELESRRFRLPGARACKVGSCMLVIMSRMLEEIREQPAALERTLKAELRRAERFKKFLEKRRPRLIILVARGTSDNAALFGRYLLEITTGIPVSLAAPSIATVYQAKVDYRDALVVAISQSGESTDTNLVLERARAAGAR